jgi:hypothetical protein
MMLAVPLEALTAAPQYSVRSLWTRELMIAFTSDRGCAEGFRADCDREGIATELVTIDAPATSTQSTP